MDEQSIFCEALKKTTAEEQAAWLDQACDGNETQKQRIVQLLRKHAEAQSFLEKPPVGLEATVMRDPSGHDLTASLDAGLALSFDGESALVIGDANHSVLRSLSNTLNEVPRVSLREPQAERAEPISRPNSPEMPDRQSDSRYRLDGEIARGGMGAIIKGRDTDLGRDLAIKVLLDSHRNKPEIVQRFVEEAQIGGQLQHPGIAPIYELGQFADKRPFFAMKLIKGHTLSKLLKERNDPAEDRGRFIGIFEQVCQTMAYAHSRGVIHRDLKPANIMVGAFGEVQVMDWGLAKVLLAGGIEDEKQAHSKHKDVSIIQTIRSGVGSDSSGVIGSIGSQTQMGSVMGTPAYMPPEQALGEIDQMDERADVFGLGAILCEILTGKPPYVADEGTRVFRMASRGKLIDCYERLDGCGADEDLIALAKHSLELEPADRPRDAGALAQRVTGYLESVEAKLREAEVQRAAEAARADAEAAQSAAERQRAEAEAAKTEAERQRAEAEYDRAETEAKRLVQQKHSGRKLKKMLAGLAALALVAGGASIVAGNYWQKAVVAQTEAEETREVALQDWYRADMNHAGLEAAAGNFELAVELLKRHVPGAGQKDLRDLEWYLMWKRIQAGLLAETVPLRIDVTRLAISADQNIAALGGWTRGVYLVDMEARTEPVLAIPRGTAPVEFFPNGRFIASAVVGETNKTGGQKIWSIEIWDASEILSGGSASPLASFPLANKPQEIAVSPDGQLIAACYRASTQIHVWKRDGENPQSVVYKKLPSISLPRYTSQGIDRVAFALDGKSLVYSSRENAMGFLAIPAQEWDSPITIDEEDLLVSDVTPHFAVTPDGKTLAYSERNQIVVRDLETARFLYKLKAGDDVKDLRWSVDGELLTSSQNDNSVLVWNPKQRTRHRVWGHSRKVQETAIIRRSGAGSPLLITANQERQLKYWQLNSANGLILDGILDCVAVATARDRSDTVLAFKNGSVELWELGSSKAPIKLYEHTGRVSQLAYSSQGVVASISDKELRLWNPATQQSTVRNEDSWEARFLAIRFSRDGETLASFHSGKIKIWNVSEGRLIRVMRHDNTWGIEGGVFLPGTTQILSDSDIGNNQFCVWDYGVKESEPSLTRRFAMDDAMWGKIGFAVDPRTDQIAVASMLGIRVLNPNSLEPLHTWKGHGDHLDSVTYASHANTLASSGRDGLLRLWDAKTFQQRLSLTAPRGHHINGLTFVGDDSALCLVEDGLLRIWQIARKDDVKAAGW